MFDDTKISPILNILQSVALSAQYRAKEESTLLQYYLYIFEPKEASKSTYKIFDQSGTKIIGLLQMKGG